MYQQIIDTVVEVNYTYLCLNMELFRLVFTTLLGCNLNCLLKLSIDGAGCFVFYFRIPTHIVVSCCNLVFKRWADTLNKTKLSRYYLDTINLYSSLSFVSLMSCSFVLSCDVSYYAYLEKYKNHYAVKD